MRWENVWGETQWRDVKSLEWRRHGKKGLILLIHGFWFWQFSLLKYMVSQGGYRRAHISTCNNLMDYGGVNMIKNGVSSLGKLNIVGDDLHEAQLTMRRDLHYYDQIRRSWEEEHVGRCALAPQWRMERLTCKFLPHHNKEPMTPWCLHASEWPHWQTVGRRIQTTNSTATVLPTQYSSLKMPKGHHQHQHPICCNDYTNAPWFGRINREV